MSSVGIIGDSFMVSDPDYFTNSTLKKLGYDKIHNEAAGGSSMVDILGQFFHIIEDYKPTHFIIGLTSCIRMHHLETDKKGKEFLKSLVSKNFGTVLLSHQYIPVIMHYVCKENNIKHFFIKNLYQCVATTELKQYHGESLLGSLNSNPIPLIPLSLQWYKHTPLDWHNDEEYSASDNFVGANHLNMSGNKICSTLLFEKLKLLGW